MELGKPDMLLAKGIKPVKVRNGIAGIGTDKKRTAICNESHKGSNFALTRKGADLSMVFYGKERRYTHEY